MQPKNYALWQKAFSQWLTQSQRIELLRHRGTKLTATGQETEREFRARVQDALREARDAEVDAMKKKFTAKRESLAEKIRKAEGSVAREQQQASQQKTQTMFSVGAAAIGALLGRKVLSTGTLGRATTAARGMGRSMKESEDVQRAGELVKTLQEQLAAFDETVREETQRIADSYDSAPELETINDCAEARPGVGAVRRARVGPAVAASLRKWHCVLIVLFAASALAGCSRELPRDVTRTSAPALTVLEPAEGTLALPKKARLDPPGHHWRLGTW